MICKAVIFDLDGVITNTAQLHSLAWKNMFNSYLKQRSNLLGENFKEFTHESDYLLYVDGKPRYKGVESFLLSRNISLEYGSQDDSPDVISICGLGNKKNQILENLIKTQGVEVFTSSLEIIKDLKKKSIKLGVASSSKNCRLVLESVGIIQLFETIVDGNSLQKLELRGKPQPDIFHKAADNLGVPYDLTVIVEDAISGVQAGRDGNFGLIIGVARENNQNELKINGADIVVEDLRDISFERIKNWFSFELNESQWKIEYNHYAPELEMMRESLCTIGNGVICTRGTFEEVNATINNYPGTYIAGVYNRTESNVKNKIISNLDLVNCPNWLPLKFKINSGEWFDPTSWKILQFKRSLNLKRGVLNRFIVVEDLNKNRTKIVSKRIISMKNPNYGAIQYGITSLNYSGKITFQTSIDSSIENKGVKRYNGLNSKHLKTVFLYSKGDIISNVSSTIQSNIHILVSAKIMLSKNEDKCFPLIGLTKEKTCVKATLSENISQYDSISLEKIVYICKFYNKNEIQKKIDDSTSKLSKIDAFDDIAKSSYEEWKKIWNKVDVKIVGDRYVQKLIRINLYHLIISGSPLSVESNLSIPARGLHGESYRGHFFWDELFFFPFYNLHYPEIAQSILIYRTDRLDQARKNAKEQGYSGALYPWQSGLDGREETQKMHLNPLTGIWSEDHSIKQRHVNLSIAYNILNYFHVSKDYQFFFEKGLITILEICRFWASISHLSSKTGRYSIKDVMGPDEFHEHYPDKPDRGINNNSYTNILVSWLLKKTLLILSELPKLDKLSLFKSIGLTEKELNLWDRISTNLFIEITDDGIISQFEGFLNLVELNLDEYRKKYECINRLDRILKSENLDVNSFQAIKQADLLMIFYMLPKCEVESILSNNGYRIPNVFLETNFDYYYKRTSHGSTLSYLVHSHVLNLLGRYKESFDFFLKTLSCDYSDIQNGTTGEGIHTGVMGGSYCMILFGYAGVNLFSDFLEIDPRLPAHWRCLNFSFNLKGCRYSFELSNLNVRIKFSSDSVIEQAIRVRGKEYFLINEQWSEIHVR
ncbi:Pyrophosphatase PpaX [Candidatus Lokiarchaeum ossiferum]|uniref:Pyrophosphatase PpaX n=1 Tax=Candidatus Lokiarchaeum ossiferum TaxID=2951803 RepID=A0ABY6HN11_9ARCH|nr:Pyrophosphatase PpaX [Candidatus Lokiarchaeum sp. B-35]